MEEERKGRERVCVCMMYYTIIIVHIKQLRNLSKEYLSCIYIIAQYVNPLRDTEPPQHSVHVCSVRRHPAV